MRSLSFKIMYVDAIIDGSKTSTIRKSTPLRAGDVVALTVGPRPAFATARVTSVESITLDDLEVEQLESVRALYPSSSVLVRVSFVLI